MHPHEMPFDDAAYLASFGDPEQRELARRQACLPGGEDAFGPGPNASLNRASSAVEDGIGDPDVRRDRLFSDLLRGVPSGILDIVMADGDPDFEVVPSVVPLRPLLPPQRLPRSQLLPGYRLAMLRGEVAIKLYTAASFMVWRYSQCFNMQVTINPRAIGLSDEKFGAALSAWNKAAAKYLARPLGEHRKRRCRRPMPATPQHHLWMYVYEHSENHGLHLHEVCVVPRDMRKGFEAHARRWWSKKAGYEITESALKFTHYGAGNRDAAIEVHFRRVCYLLKSVDPSATRLTEDGYVPLTKIFRTEPYHRPDPNGVAVAQLYGHCRELRVDENSRLVHLPTTSLRYESALERGDYEGIYSGWEYEWIKTQAMISTLA